jgi:uncharacterized membrane protein
MSPIARRVTQAILYEVFAILLVGPVLSLLFDEPMSSSIALTIILSTIALCWNYIFNSFFERWEARQTTRHRTFKRRLAHGVGFEIGLVVLLTPVMATWLETTWVEALMTNLGLLLFFLFYAVVFTRVFDLIFGPPQSARD